MQTQSLQKPRTTVSFTLILVLLLAAQPIATDLYLPALPSISHALGPASSSLTLFMLGFGVGQLLNGPLADRFGRRPTLLSGLLLYALAAVAAALSPSVLWLAACRATQGLAMAAILVCVRAAVRDRYPAHEGPRVLAVGLSGLGLVAMLAPLLGALVVQTLNWRWALGCMAVYALVVWCVCYCGFEETLRPEHAEQQGSVLEVFASGSFWAWTMVTAVSYGGIFCFLLLSSTIYVDYLGLSTLAYGWVPASGSLVYIASTFLCRRLLHTRSAARTVQIGAMFSLTGAAILVASCVWAPHRVWPLLVGHWVYALGHGIHQPCGQAGAVANFPHLAARAVAWSGFITMAMAFCVGQTAVRFMGGNLGNGAWPMVVPMAFCAALLFLVSRVWLPGLGRSQSVSA